MKIRIELQPFPRKYYAEQFFPKVRPWPSGVIQNNHDGQFVEDSYFVIIPMRSTEGVREGDYILYDEMGNVEGVLSKHTVSHWYASANRIDLPVPQPLFGEK
jgi:hypothetical protein